MTIETRGDLEALIQYEIDSRTPGEGLKVDARDILTAIESAGLVVCPEVLTDRMRVYVHDQTWANAVNAAPFKSKS